LKQALAAAPDAEPALRAAALNGRGELLRELGQRADALRSYEMARELERGSGDRAGEAMALTVLSSRANDVSDYVAQKPLNERSIAIWRELGDRRGLARALHTLAWAEAGFGNVEAATALFREALGHARAAGDARWTARSLDSLGNMLVLQSEFSAARPSSRRAAPTLWAAPRWCHRSAPTSPLTSVSASAPTTAPAPAKALPTRRACAR
jgi:tetratricopeptide (TPR) repeat protein